MYCARSHLLSFIKNERAMLIATREGAGCVLLFVNIRCKHHILNNFTLSLVSHLNDRVYVV